MKKLRLVLFFQCIIFSLTAQYPQVNFENFSFRQGLPEYETFCVMQDHNGFIWLGGDHGLYKYNGYDFTYFKSLPGCRNCQRILEGVFSIKEDKHGLLWILSEAGIAVYNPENERSIMVCPTISDSSSANSFLTKELIIDSRGNIWSTGQTGLIKISWKKDFNAQLNTNGVFNNPAQKVFNIKYFQLSKEKYGPDNNVNSVYKV